MTMTKQGWRREATASSSSFRFFFFFSIGLSISLSFFSFFYCTFFSSSSLLVCPSPSTFFSFFSSSSSLSGLSISLSCFVFAELCYVWSGFSLLFLYFVFVLKFPKLSTWLSTAAKHSCQALETLKAFNFWIKDELSHHFFSALAFEHKWCDIMSVYFHIAIVLQQIYI